MTASLQALLHGAIDYAGMFPPASLSLEEAVERYAIYRADAHSWMLNRFVIPAARLPDLDALLVNGDTFRVAALARGGDSVEEFLGNLNQDLRAIRDFRGGHVEVIECRMPVAVAVESTAAWEDLLRTTASRLIAQHVWPVTTYWEVPGCGDCGSTAAWEATLDAIASTAAQYSTGSRMGLKLRTGALDPRAVPTPAHVAEFICACRDAGVFWKATAGLHHALSNFYGPAGPMHGFLNVLVASVLALAHHLSETAVESIVSDDEPGNFHFTDDALGWRDLTIGAAEVCDARDKSLHSFGSCSFDEPVEDLRALGLL